MSYSPQVRDEVTIVYDESFYGFMSAVFYIYENKIQKPIIQKESVSQSSLFGENVFVQTDIDKAKRVIKKLKLNCSRQGFYRMYSAFLSEVEEVEILIFRFIQYILSSKTRVDSDYSHPVVLKISQLAKSVGREKHRMEAFIRFRLTKDDIYFAHIEPDFNVLPIITKHFKSRYADQKWLIYDLKRRYGISYDMKKVEIIELELTENVKDTLSSPLIFKNEEIEFQELWKNYFKSTNIASRRNMKLHIQHVPKRYWKYLIEKQDF